MLARAALFQGFIRELLLWLISAMLPSPFHAVGVANFSQVQLPAGNAGDSALDTAMCHVILPVCKQMTHCELREHFMGRIFKHANIRTYVNG